MISQSQEAFLTDVVAMGLIDDPEDEHARVRLGAAPETPADVLAGLATDSSVLVRSAVALNRATPAVADKALTTDPDERVRAVLARKLGALLPSLTGEDHSALAADCCANLRVLVCDEAERVRAVVAETLKDMPDLCRDVLMALAQDPCFSVSDPILRLSPALSEADLLTLIRAKPAAHTIASIAARPVLNETLCDAIAASADDMGIRAMLSNHSASLRESTLDQLVAQAAGHTGWHEPMVRRPVLSANSARMLAEYVCGSLLQVLAARQDLTPSVLTVLRERLTATSEAKPVAGKPQGRRDLPQNWPRAGASWHTEAELIDAIRHGDLRRVSVVLAAASGLTLDAVEHAAQTRNARAAVALLWKGGFTMRAAAAVQTMLFGLRPESALLAGPDGEFPLSRQEMQGAIALMAKYGPEV